MGRISNETKRGIVTLVDEEYNYVWSVGLGGLELRYKHNPGVQFQCGEVVRYIQTHPTKSIQDVNNLLKSEYKFPIESDQRLRWKLKVKLTFAPPDAAVLKEIQKNDEEERLTAIAYTSDFELVASFVPGVNFKPGVVYEAYITRVPKGYWSLSEKIGTVFMVIGGKTKEFEKVTDQTEIDKVMEGCPWKEMVLPRGVINEETGLADEHLSLKNNVRANYNQQNGNGSESSDNDDYHQNQTTTSEQANRNESKFKHLPDAKYFAAQFQEEPLIDDFAKQLQNQMEGDEHLGLIVGCEREYSVIWSPEFSLVRLQLEENQNPASDPIWPEASWVKFRCFPEQSILVGQRTCRYTAYDARRTPGPPGMLVRTLGHSEHEFGKGVAVQMSLTKRRSNSTAFFIAEDNFFKCVLCPVHDKKFLERFGDNDDAIVQVMAFFSYEYQNSKWIAFSVLSEDGNSWRKLDGLPSKIEAEVQPFFRTTTHYSHEEQLNQLTAANQFKTPTGWRGEKEEGDKLIDVLGLVTCHEDSGQTSVIATKFGFARQPIKWELGTWVRATLVPDEEESPFTYSNVLRGYGSYIVLKSNKIPPLMSTRVVIDNGFEKILLCCKVTISDQILMNEYLGTIYDENDRLDKNQRGINGKPITSFLVEISLGRENKNKESRYWKVLKNHGEYTNTVNIVALKLSYFPNSMGRTCDEAHVILFDPEFDLQKYEEQKKTKEKTPNSGAIPPHQQQQFIQKPSTSKQPISFSEAEVTNESKQQRHYQFGNDSEPSSLNHHFDEKRELPIATNGIRDNQIGQQAVLISQLSLYEPADTKNKRAVGIVVTKHEQFAILYSREFGDCIVLPRYCPDQTEFERIFQLGKLVGVAFAQVALQMKRGLLYSNMCLPEFKPSTAPITSRVVLNRFVQIRIKCEFRKTNIKECVEDLNSGENEKRYYIETDVGKVLMNPDVIDKNELFGKAAKLWITHIQKKYGCHWQIALGDFTTLQEVNMTEDEKYEIEIVAEREYGHPRSFSAHYYQQHSSIPNQIQSSIASHHSLIDDIVDNGTNKNASNLNELMNAPIAEGNNSINQKQSMMRLVTNGYADFVFGSHVPDMNGERYPAERYAPRENVDSDFDDEDAEENEIIGVESSNEDNNSDLTVESFHTDNNFSDENADVDFAHKMRIIGGSSPPPPRHPLRQGPSVAAANSQSMQGAGPSFAYDTVHHQQQEQQNGGKPVDDLISF